MNVVFTTAALVVTMSLWAQESDPLARVQKIQGKEVYVLNQPVRNYEVVGSVNTGLKISSILTRGLVNEHVNDKTAQFTRRAIRKLNKKEIAFDGLLYTSGKTIQAIRFTDSDYDQAELARVNEIEGVRTFVMAEPVKDYEVVETVGGGIKFIPLLTYGFINNSIARDVRTYARKANKEMEAETVNIAYQTGRKASIISFE